MAVSLEFLGSFGQYHLSTINHGKLASLVKRQAQGEETDFVDFSQVNITEVYLS